jgi:hypothetical protein
MSKKKYDLEDVAVWIAAAATSYFFQVKPITSEKYIRQNVPLSMEWHRLARAAIRMADDALVLAREAKPEGAIDGTKEIAKGSGKHVDLYLS